MASTPGTSDRGRRLSRSGGGGLRRGRASAAAAIDLHPLAAAYVLDALDERQREAFAAHLPECATCRDTLAWAPGPLAALTVAATPLAPAPPTLAATLRAVVIDVLPQTSQVEVAWTPTPIPSPASTPAHDPASATTVGRSETANTASGAGSGEYAAAPVAAPGEGSASAPSWDAWAHRGPAATDGADEGRGSMSRGVAADSEGRSRPGLPPELTGGWTERADDGRPATRGAPLVAVVAIAVVAVAMLVWAMLERQTLGDMEGELAAQRTVVADIRANANAASFTMVPTESGPTAAAGTAFFALPAMRGALVLEGMPSLPEDQAYQLWYVAPDGTVTPGPAAAADRNGGVVLAIDATGLTVERLYVTVAPPSGATIPDFDQFPPLLLGILGGATG